MKKRFTNKSGWPMRLLAVSAIAGALLPGGAWGANPLPLSQIPIPKPPELAAYVKNEAAAIKLGKALFWDMQVGSDGLTACASCHYKAGADPLNVRPKNQLHPGPNGAFDVGPANFTLLPADFPLIQVSPVDASLRSDGTFNGGIVTRNFDDVTGSQGVFKTNFNAVILGSAVDSGTPVTDTVFTFGGSNVRQVTGRNTPPSVNAVFNYDNFWDGRGKNIFNGSSPIGPLDQGAGIWLDIGGTLVKTSIAITNASLASQAVGPPLSDVEMSYAGRTWPDVGKKMLSLEPLAAQFVHPQDSVLGPFSKATLAANGTLTGAKGINGTYAQMIMDTFQDNLWNSAATTGGHTQMEANFSLFWGLAIQLYEATLVSDQTPFDQFLTGNTTAMSQAAQNGFNTFQSQCAKCHSGSELSNATHSFAAEVGNLVEIEATNVATSISDVGFSNLGIRPTAEDIGRGAVINFPLSFAAQAKLLLPFAPFPLPAGATTAFPLAVDGGFKTPQLRNVELTAPYFHTGGAATLAEVVETYARGGNFANPEMDAEMQPIGPLGNQTARDDMVAFLTALTDERVRNDTAPFDHPELFIPNGDPSPSPLIHLPATGAIGMTTAGAMTSPANASTLAGASQTFTWSNAGATRYQLWVGTAPGKSDLGVSHPGTATTTNVISLPANGSTIYVRLYSKFGTTWVSNDYSYTAAGTLATMTSPANASTLTGAGQTFTWSNAGANSYQLWVGTAPGKLNLGVFRPGTATTTNVTGLPANGSTIYVRLYSKIGLTWYFSDYSYTSGA